MARSRACHAARHTHARLRDDAHPGSLDNLTGGSRTVWQATPPSTHPKMPVPEAEALGFSLKPRLCAQDELG
jgi:hypothetical protein